MPDRIDIRQSDDPRDVIHRAIQLLSEGQTVGLPTETGQCLAALATSKAAVSDLAHAPAEAISQHCSLGVKGANEALDFVPHTSHTGHRLMRRCWPGPVILSFADGYERGPWSALPEETVQALGSSEVASARSLRVSKNEVFQEILRLLPAPVLCRDIRPGEGGSLNGSAPKSLQLMIENGAPDFTDPVTRVIVEGDAWRIAESGVVTESMLRRLSARVVLFVCTGNTCRSPMAEAIFRKLMSERLGCAEDELADRGYLAISAGLMAANGHPASPESVEVLQPHGIDATMHASRALTESLLDQSDDIFTMTHSHLEGILHTRSDLSDKSRLLSSDGCDISDPIGGTLEDYESCRRQITEEIQSIVETMTAAAG